MAFLGIKYKGIQVFTNLGQDAVIPQAPGGGSSYEPEAAAYFSAVEAQGGTLAENVKGEYNDFILREKLSNNLSKVRRLIPMIGGTANSILVDSITTNLCFQQNILNSDVDPVQGWTGDGATKYMLTDANYGSIVSNYRDHQWGFFHDNFNPVGQGIKYGLYQGSIIHGSYITSNQMIGYHNTSAQQSRGTRPTLGSNIYFSSITTPTNGYVSINGQTGSQIYSGAISTALLNAKMGINCAYNSNGTVTSFSTDKCMGHYIAEGMSLAEVQAFEASYQLFVNNIRP